ncbi:TadE family protein [Cellulomonas sp. H30R-01]|uniref:TadE family type IV pilus minor pilin n=1 Tax=Cellulomonas sp. H30R-01 TaxID=2704467 RepID=UPI00138D39D9|nr:TadE family type IV pilus minor pilin [Cellulomonas sp. H30R-01]QHT56767.1 TadE family protein [Cellulomonas sp. H30R-01]
MRDAGSVTAELAVGLPVVVLLLVVVLAVVGAGLTRAQCLDGARAGARALALGESSSDAAATARRVAGDGARVRTTRDGEWVTVVVEASVPVGGLRLGPLETRGSATARVEP